MPDVNNSKALATIGVIASDKAISMASLGLFGISSPTPPPPGIHELIPPGLLINVGRLMS